MLKDWNSLKDVFHKLSYILTGKQKKISLIVLFLILVGAVFETIGVSAVMPLVQVMLSPEAILNNAKYRDFLEKMGVGTPRQIILLIGIGVIVIYLVKNIYMSFLAWIRVKFACKVQRELSVNMMQSYMKKGYTYFLNVNTGDIIRGINSDVLGVYQILYQGLRIITEVFSVICICVFIMVTDIQMALCVIILASFSMLLVIFGFRRHMQKLGVIFQEYASVVNSSILQAFQGIKEIIVMHRQNYFTERYKSAYIEQQKAVVGQNVAAESPAYIIEAVCVSGLLAVVCLKALGGTTATEFIPQLAAFAIAAFRILPSIGKISSASNTFIFYCPSLNTVYSNLHDAQEHDRSPQQISILKAEMEEKDKKGISFQKNLVLENVFWQYPGAESPVLSRINMTIGKGRSVALIGQSGAGKTTLADVILGLLQPQTGSVKVDGTDISTIPIRWSKMVGYVPQAVYLTDESIRNNVAFGIENKNIDEERVWKALEQAQLKKFVEELPQKLDTVVGERGIRFSGGQRQRVAIARALYYDPEILVLDEATAALDTETETAVMESINALQRKKTLIIVAHRLTTIMSCDVIYEIGGGQAVRKKIEDVIPVQENQN